MKDKSVRFLLLDPARGLAALAVMFFHRGQYPSFFFPLNQVIKYGEVGAYIFFVISGYVIYQSAEHYFPSGTRGSVKFGIKRFWRIYPPFLASVILSLLVAILIQQKAFGVLDILGTATLLPLDLQSPNGSYWTLVYEVQFYLAMFVLILPIFARYRVGLVLASSVIAVAHSIGVLSNHWVNSTLPSHWLEFDLGIMTYLLIQGRVQRRWTIPIFTALVVVAFSTNYRMQAAALFAIAMLLLYPIDKRLMSKQWMAPVTLLGLISYSLYLVHLPAFALNDALLRNILDPGSLEFYVAGILVAFLVAVPFFLAFERPFKSRDRQFQTTGIRQATSPNETRSTEVI